MALALGDALAVVISNELHINVQAVFSQNHPGGAIGQAIPKKLSDLTIPLASITKIGTGAIAGAHILMSAYRSKTHCVHTGMNVVVPPRRIKRLGTDDMDEPALCILGLMVPCEEWIEMRGEIEIAQVENLIFS